MNKYVVRDNEVVKFWFEEIDKKFWWKKDTELDRIIVERFQTTHHAAIQGKLLSWRKTALGRLAEVIVLDQFSRNLYRDSPLAFAYDNQALMLAQEAIHVKAEQELDPRPGALNNVSAISWITLDSLCIKGRYKNAFCLGFNS